MNNDVFPNKFKAALAAKQVKIGCWSALSNRLALKFLVWLGLTGWCWMANMRQTISPRLSAVNGLERQRQRASSASADQRAGNY